MLDDYRKSIDLLASTQNTFVFDGEGAEKAAIVIASIFKHAQSTVRIYAKDMNGEISGYSIYLDSLFKFLNTRKNLEVLLDSPDHFLHLNKRLQHLIQSFYPQGNVEFRIASEAFKESLRSIATDGQTLYHFVVGDEKMLRIELDSNVRSFICSFNNPRMARPLVRVFDQHFEASKLVEIAEVPLAAAH